MELNPKVSFQGIENGDVRNCYNGTTKCQQMKNNASCDKDVFQEKREDFHKNGEQSLKSLISNGELEEFGSARNEETVQKYKTRLDQNGLIYNGKHAQNGSIENHEHFQNGLPVHNGKSIQTANSRKYVTEELLYDQSKSERKFNKKMSYDKPNNEYPISENNVKSLVSEHCLAINGQDCSGSVINGKSLQNSVLVNDHLTAEDLQSLFSDKICVLHIPNYIPRVVCDKLDRFLQEKGSDQYTHEIRSEDGTADLQYFGVNRYGYPLNSTYNDNTNDSLKRYFSEALPTMRAIRRAAGPYLSPIDKLRVELDELWNGNVNVATLNGRKTFCGIGRIMPASLSELSADQPHFDAIPTSYFPNIWKQFAANIYLNVPGEGGELEIWNVSPVDVDNVENFTIPENWRSKLPESIRVKPGPGDLLLLNTRRPHAITKFAGIEPRTSIQTFIGLTKDSDVFLWV